MTPGLMTFQNPSHYTIDRSAHEVDRLLEFRLDALRPVSIVHLCLAIFGGGIAFVTYTATASTPIESVMPAFLIYCAILFSYLLSRFNQGGLAVALSPDVIFLAVYTTFHLGYVGLFAFGFVPYTEKIFYYEGSIPKSLLLINLGLAAFIGGYELMGTRGSMAEAFTVPRRPSSLWCSLGTAMLVLAAVVHVGVLVSLGPAYLQRYGYVGLQNIGKYNPYYLQALWALSGMLAPAGVTIHIVGSALRRRKLFDSPVAKGMAISFFCMYVLEGDRTPMLMLVIPCLLVRHHFIRRVRIRYLVGIGAGLLFLFSAIALVRTTVFNPSKMAMEYQHRSAQGDVTWMNPFLEMGGSFLPLNITCNDVPTQEPYWYGASWFSAATHVVPFLQSFIASRGWARWAPSDWVTTTYFGRDAAGRGFTIVAEGYLNFGYLGTIAEVALIGMFIRWLIIRFAKNASATRALIFLGCFGPTVALIRNHLNTVTNIYMYVFVLAFLLHYALGEDNTASYASTHSATLPGHALGRW